MFCDRTLFAQFTICSHRSSITTNVSERSPDESGLSSASTSASRAQRRHRARVLERVGLEQAGMESFAAEPNFR